MTIRIWLQAGRLLAVSDLSFADRGTNGGGQAAGSGATDRRLARRQYPAANPVP